MSIRLLAASRWGVAASGAVALATAVALVFFLVRASHASAVQQQHIANCVVAYHYTWAHCARLMRP